MTNDIATVIRSDINLNIMNKSLTLNIIQPIPEKEYTLLSWNVDGYTPDIHVWLKVLAQTTRPDIIFLSETKKKAEDLTLLFGEFTDYNVILNVHVPASMHGVAMLIRNDHVYEHLPVQMNIAPRSDTKVAEAGTGRIILIKLDQKFFIIGSYTPNSRASGDIKHIYRTTIWDPAFFALLEILRSHGGVIWLGDVNTALDEIDVSNPDSMKRYAGFTLEERTNLRSLLDTGNWIDIWRYQHPNDRIYTWCGNPPRANYGMRLDNIIISDLLVPNILTSFMISDGCPISADHIIIGAMIKI